MVSGYVKDGIMEIVSSPAKKLEAAMARLVLRGVFPKKDIAGGLDDPPVAAPVAMVIDLCRIDYWVGRLASCAMSKSKINVIVSIFHVICTRD